MEKDVGVTMAIEIKNAYVNPFVLVDFVLQHWENILHDGVNKLSLKKNSIQFIFFIIIIPT